MKVLPPHEDLVRYCKAHGLEKKFAKQLGFFKENPFHSSLKTELLEPKHMKVWSFRIDRTYRAIFIFRDRNTIEILDINNHYQ